MFASLEFGPEPEREKQGDQNEDAGNKYKPREKSDHHFSASSAFLLIMSISSAKLLVFKIWLNWSL